MRRIGLTTKEKGAAHEINKTEKNTEKTCQAFLC